KLRTSKLLLLIFFIYRVVIYIKHMPKSSFWFLQRPPCFLLITDCQPPLVSLLTLDITSFDALQDLLTRVQARMVDVFSRNKDLLTMIIAVALALRRGIPIDYILKPQLSNGLEANMTQACCVGFLLIRVGVLIIQHSNMGLPIVAIDGLQHKVLISNPITEIIFPLLPFILFFVNNM
ncbi:hypothetical protein ACJX0J_007186, partial [Zea mays]